MRTNEPGMNITGQINKALDDMRKALVDLSCEASDLHMKKAELILYHCTAMVINHRDGVKSQPWSDIWPIIDEEFDDYYDYYVNSDHHLNMVRRH